MPAGLVAQTIKANFIVKDDVISSECHFKNKSMWQQIRPTKSSDRADYSEIILAAIDDIMIARQEGLRLPNMDIRKLMIC